MNEIDCNNNIPRAYTTIHVGGGGMEKLGGKSGVDKRTEGKGKGKREGRKKKTERSFIFFGQRQRVPSK